MIRIIYHVLCFIIFFFFKQKTAYEMRISDGSSDVCSSDLPVLLPEEPGAMRRQVPLAQVAQIRFTEGLNEIRRENGKRRVVVQLNLEGRDAGSFVQEAQAKIAQVKLPAGYYLEWGGQVETSQAATARDRKSVGKGK